MPCRMPKPCLRSWCSANVAPGRSWAVVFFACPSPLLHTVTASGFCTAPARVIGYISPYPQNGRILLANSNQWYFNKLVKIPCHKTPYRCPHRLNLSSQSNRSCAEPNIKVLKDKDLEFANSIRAFYRL